MSRTGRRFMVVEVCGQFYECAFPSGSTLVRICLERYCGEVTRVWIECAD